MPTINVNETQVKTIWPWTFRFGYYKLDLFDSAITVLVSRYPNSDKKLPAQVQPKYVAMWEIIIGNKYISRDKEKFFETADAAIVVAERLVGQLGCKIVEKTGVEAC